MFVNTQWLYDWYALIWISAFVFPLNTLNNNKNSHLFWNIECFGFDQILVQLFFFSNIGEFFQSNVGPFADPKSESKIQLFMFFSLQNFQLPGRHLNQSTNQAKYFTNWKYALDTTKTGTNWLPVPSSGPKPQIQNHLFDVNRALKFVGVPCTKERYVWTSRLLEESKWGDETEKFGA